MTRANKATDRAFSTDPQGETVDIPFFAVPEPAKQALLLAGATVFGEKGLDGASTREIATLAKQNLAAIVYYFGSKEGLYFAIAKAIGEEIAARLATVVDALNTHGPKLERDQALALLRRLLTMMLQMVMASKLPAVSQFIAREQQKSGPAFALIYDNGMRRVHETMTYLIAVVFEMPWDSLAAKLHAHALMGQVLGFRMAYAALLHRTGWTEVGPRQVQQITEVVLNHLELMAAGHAHRSQPSLISRTPRLRKTRRPKSSS